MGSQRESKTTPGQRTISRFVVLTPLDEQPVGQRHNRGFIVCSPCRRLSPCTPWLSGPRNLSARCEPATGGAPPAQGAGPPCSVCCDTPRTQKKEQVKTKSRDIRQEQKTRPHVAGFGIYDATSRLLSRIAAPPSPRPPMSDIVGKTAGAVGGNPTSAAESRMLLQV